MQPKPEAITREPNEFRMTFKEKTPSGFNKYILNIPLHPSKAILEKLEQQGAQFPLDRVKLTLYSENDLSIVKDVETLQKIIGEKEQSSFPVMLLNGLLSNSDQYDRTGTSFIRKLTDMVRSDGTHGSFNPLYIGMSAPGFSGSQLSLADYGPLDVGVRRYEAILEAVQDELRFPKVKGAIIGHSAGGAAVLEYEHETIQDRLAKIALCPAIHLREAPQFDYIDKLLTLQERTVYPSEMLRNVTSHKVVRYLLGIPQGIPFKKLPKQVQEQIEMHVAELEAHRYATHQKLKELYIPLRRGQPTIQATLNVVAEHDILTPPSQIRAGFPEDIGAFLTIPNGHHDDIFINEETQTMVLPLIASYIATGQVNLVHARQAGLTGI